MLPVALSVQAHHGRLKNHGLLEDAIQNTGAALLQDAIRDGLPPDILVSAPPQLPHGSEEPLYLARATRFLFSSLVNADSLDTEDWDRGGGRRTSFDSIGVLADRVEAACTETSRLALARSDSPLNRMRAEVLQQCLASASLAPGAFTLTVPTGGGKTLSGLAFALRHAAGNRLRRVIFVAPYTSILEQTVKVFRKALGESNVVEHHSNIDPDEETDRNRQACENWDAPVIVTTSVQLFETLYAGDKRRCRTLHRIGGSIIFLDEVQTVLNSPHRGRRSFGAAERFFCLVVSGAQGRAMLRSMHTGTLADLEANLNAYFDAIRLEGDRPEPKPLGFLLRSLVLQGKLDRLPPRLAGEVFLGILFGGKLPRLVLSAAVQRNQAEQKVTPERAALIQLFFTSHQMKEVPRMSLIPNRKMHPTVWAGCSRPTSSCSGGRRVAISTAHSRQAQGRKRPSNRRDFHP